MKPERRIAQPRRDFLTQLGVATAIFAGGAAHSPQSAEAAGDDQMHNEQWDVSWLDALAKAPYKVVFDASSIAEGYALDLAGVFLDHYHEVHNTTDSQTRAVIVMRQLGTPLALGDAMWDKYAIGEELKINDRATRQPARRNPYFKATGGSDYSLETLRARGTIFLLCNIAMNNWSSRHADLVKRPLEEVREEVRANLIPGTIVVPSGIFAIIRAQNAGCAFMRAA